MASKPTYRPVRSLALLAAILIAAFSAIVVRDLEPRLGLDLRGGTSVVLTPDEARTGGRVTDDNLDKAVDIIRQRVNATGVAEAEVVVEGGNILVALPDVGREKALALVGRTAQLSFRPLINQANGDPNAPTPSPQPLPSVSINPVPGGSAVATLRPNPTGTASGSARPATTSPTARPRPVSGALLAQSRTPSATPTPRATGTATPRASGTATPTATPSLDPLALQKAYESADCTDPVQRAALANKDDAKQVIIACSREGDLKYLLGPAELTGTVIKDASAVTDPATGQFLISFELTSAGRKSFGDVTTKYTGQPLAIVLDGIVQSAPNINEPITGGEGQISGDFTPDEAKDLANVLRFGALPIVFDQSSVETISPTLGEDSLNGGVLAGLLGLGVVVIYLICYYRTLGLVITSGLLVFSALNYAAVVLLGDQIDFTLTLAGIAGLIIAVGISADSYVVLFERVRDEASDGRTARVAVDRGFVGARRTILTANSVSFLAAAVLYVLSVGAVRGFAFTLGMATLLDLVMFFLFTRPVTALMARRKGAARTFRASTSRHGALAAKEA